MADGSSGSGETDRIFFGSLENEVKARISKVSISQIILYISFGICSQVYASPQLEQLFPFSFFFFFLSTALPWSGFLGSLLLFCFDVLNGLSRYLSPLFCSHFSISHS
jgi:hypothetical protein